MFWTNKKFVYLIFIKKLSLYHPKMNYENIIKKDMNKFLDSEFKIVKWTLFNRCLNSGQDFGHDFH